MENSPVRFPRRRTRIISFRVSEREFELLKGKSDAEGAHSLSDFARLTLCGGKGASERIDQGMTRLSEELQQLSADVRQMAEVLQEARPAARAPLTLTATPSCRPLGEFRTRSALRPPGEARPLQRSGADPSRATAHGGSGGNVPRTRKTRGA